MPFNVTYGYGFGLQRGWLRPLPVGERIVIPVSHDAIQLTFYNRSGGLLGRIRTDVQHPSIKEVSFQRDRAGCGDATLKLFELPRFPIPPFSQVGIRFGRSLTDHYRGYLNVDDLEGTTRDEYEFSISGLREQLQRGKVNRVIPGVVDVSDVITDIYDNDIGPGTDIAKNPAKIFSPSGVLTTTLDFSKEPIADALESLATMAGYDAGVDEDGDLYFLPKHTETRRVFFVGITLPKFAPRKDLEQTKNSIVIQRNNPTGPGWVVATIRQNVPSQKKYGLREEFFKVPGHFEDTTCELIGDRLIEQKSEPRFAARTLHYLFTEADLFPPGFYRFIAPLGDYAEEVSEADTLDGWSKVGTGDLSLAIDENIFMTGSGALRLNYTTATGDYARFVPPSPFRGQIKKLRFYVRSSKTGAYLTVGFGESVWNEHTRIVPVNVANVFNLIEWDVSALNTDLAVFGIRIDDPDGGIVYIDRVDIVRRDYRHYNLELQKVKYRFNAKRNEATVDWGEMPPELDDYITQLLAYARANEFRSEDR